MQDVPTALLKLKMDCKHIVETRIYYDYTSSKHDKWEGRLIFCRECKKLRKVLRVAGGGKITLEGGE